MWLKLCTAYYRWNLFWLQNHNETITCVHSWWNLLCKWHRQFLALRCQILQIFSKSCLYCRAEIVTCLSEIVRDDILTDGKHRISEKCQSQLRVEVLRMVMYCDSSFLYSHCTIDLPASMVIACRQILEHLAIGWRFDSPAGLAPLW